MSQPGDIISIMRKALGFLYDVGPKEVAILSPGGFLLRTNLAMNRGICAKT
jgi:hypothetical protein